MSPPIPTNFSPPTSTMRQRKPAVPVGFRPPPKPKPRLISQMTVRELHDLHDRNAKILSAPAASTSTYVQRLSAEQAAIEARLVELDGMETIRIGLKNTRINADETMNVDEQPEPPFSRTIEAKRRALSRFAPIAAEGASSLESISIQEAIALEQRAHAQDAERREQIIERKRRQGKPIKGEVLSRQEREARIWAFMNYKPSESDLEDDEDEDEDEEEDPSTWFEDDQDDGRKGQDIIEPDYDDISNVIRIDESRAHYSTFYEPRDDGD